MADHRFRYSRVALKKYVKANNSINATDKMFDVLFNKALKTGVEKGEFSQPKGMYLFHLFIEARCLKVIVVLHFASTRLSLWTTLSLRTSGRTRALPPTLNFYFVTSD
jgi:hypothetical protein